MSTGMFATIIVCLGLLGVVLSLGLSIRKRFLAGISISVLIISVGLVSFVIGAMDNWRTKTRGNRMREDNLRRLEELRSQFRTLPASPTDTGKNKPGARAR